MSLYNGYFAEGFGLDPSGTVIVTDCPISEYLDRKGAFYLEFPLNDKYYYYSAEQNDGDTDLQILHNMMATEYEFHIEGKKDGTEVPNLKSHLDSRKASVERAQNFNLSWGIKNWLWKDQGNSTNQEFFEKLNNIPWYQFGIGHSDYSCHCNVALELVSGGGYIGRPVDNIWIPGDSTYILNINARNNKLFTRHYEGQNLLYLGSNQFWGHSPGKTTKSLKEWMDSMLKWKSIDGKIRGLSATPKASGQPVGFPPTGLEKKKK